MTVLTLLLLLLTTATPALLPVLRRRILDPVLPVAGAVSVLLALAAAIAAATTRPIRPTAGSWRPPSCWASPRRPPVVVSSCAASSG